MQLFKIDDGDVYYWYGAEDLEGCKALFLKDQIELAGEYDGTDAALGAIFTALNEEQGRGTDLAEDTGESSNMWEGMLSLTEPGVIACSEY